MSSHVEALFWGTTRLLSEGSGSVHIAYADLYASIMFLACIYVGGQIAARLLRMPSLVGEIFAGILLGPNLAGYVPNPVAFVMLGEIGLILLVIEAGVDIDLTTLKLIGSRGMLIAIVGSFLPIVFAFIIAIALDPTNIQSAIAAGACFGPTSLGIAMNILRQAKLVNTPVGQLIVSAAVIDDMIALIILSQLGALAGEVTVASVLVPIVSAIAFLGLGGYAAVFILPPILDKYFYPRFKKENNGAAGLALMFLLLFAMMPATYYAKSSFLMGAFLSGLVFCRNHDVHVRFVTQFKRLLQWLMRIFFAASIGFQVPIKDFGNGKVIGYGCLFTLALLGKLLVGFMVPNFNVCDKYKGLHLRDCLCTGFSMAAEGEFAFVIAVFSVDNGLISADLYAAIVLAVLLSTIVPPFALRYTISHYDKLAQNIIKHAEEMEKQRGKTLDTANLSPEEKEQLLREDIEANKVIFLCIQIKCASSWGLVPKIISSLSSLKLEVIDNRSWHPRGVDSTLMTEIFVQDQYFLRQDDEEDAECLDKGATTSKYLLPLLIDNRIGEVNDKMVKAIRQPGANIKVTRWYPGVLQKIVEEVKTKSSTKNEITTSNDSQMSVRDLLAREASHSLESKRNMQVSATKAKSLSQVKQEMGIIAEEGPTTSTKTRKRVRQKMRSTPLIGGSLFDEQSTEVKVTKPTSSDLLAENHGGEKAELIVGGEVFTIRVMPETVHRIRSGYSGELLDDNAVKLSASDIPIEHHLEGFVRSNALQTINEDISDSTSQPGSESFSEW